jgi:O-antigen/teichoic acid export membrane protein
MSFLKSLLKDTALYGLTSIVGRFLNYLLVPVYTKVMPAVSGEYGVVTNMYAYTALILAILTGICMKATDPLVDRLFKRVDFSDSQFVTPSGRRNGRWC